MSDLLYLDLATAPIADAKLYIDLEDFEAPENYVDKEKIAAYIARAKSKAYDKCALDVDLCRISGIGMGFKGETRVELLKDADKEGEALANVAKLLDTTATLVSFNGARFDWPVLIRRARVYGIAMRLNMDRYKSEHLDVLERMTHYGKLKARSLEWYVKRYALGKGITKPLSGAEEAQVFTSKAWPELAESLTHDVEALMRLTKWNGWA